MQKQDIVVGGLWTVVGLGGGAMIAVLTVDALPPLLGGFLLFGGLAFSTASLGALAALFLGRDKSGPLGRRDTNASDAIAYGATRKWGSNLVEVTTDGHNMIDVMRAFEQAALSGEIRVWGEIRRDGPHDLIDREFWRNHTLDWFSLLRGKPTTSKLNELPPLGSFEGLMVSRREIERLWPKPRRRLSIRWAPAA